MIKRTRITENIYNAVKLILRGGAKTKEAAEAMGISVNSVHRIDKANSYDEYVNMAYMNGSARYREQEKKEKEERQEKPHGEPLKLPGGQLSSGYQINRIYELLKEQNEILKLLSNKVAFVVDELTK